MSIIKVAVIGIVSVLLGLQFKNIKSEYGTIIVLVAAICIFFFGITKVNRIIEAVNLVKSGLGISGSYIQMLLKIVGISYICEFSSDICKDSGYSALSNQIHIFGKLSILVISAPVFLKLFDVIGGML
ncbi:MAG: stage III sporulation protein AD [Lachnospiraceae bacterium]|nr:stage III sporulation protein AD [Lachnospiraceae bacterium]